MKIVRLTQRYVELNGVVDGKLVTISYMNSPNGRTAIVNDLDPSLVMEILKAWGTEATEEDVAPSEPSTEKRGTWVHTLETVPGTGVATVITPDVCHFDIMGDLVYIFNENIITYRLHRGTGQNFTCQQLIFHGLPYDGVGKVNAFLWSGLTNYATRSCIVRGKDIILNLSTGLSVSNTNVDVSISFNGIYQRI
ncbi:MAG: hypothetical protein FWC41_06350 [Firmicutes bacterium]|nr:hypothetical protein [Bacillota bacterium]